MDSGVEGVPYSGNMSTPSRVVVGDGNDLCGESYIGSICGGALIGSSEDRKFGETPKWPTSEMNGVQLFVSSETDTSSARLSLGAFNPDDGVEDVGPELEGLYISAISRV